MNEDIFQLVGHTMVCYVKGVSNLMNEDIFQHMQSLRGKEGYMSQTSWMRIFSNNFMYIRQDEQLSASNLMNEDIFQRA